MEFTYWGISIVLNPLEDYTTHLLELMVEYQLAQSIKELTELMPNRILVLMYLLHSYTP